MIITKHTTAATVAQQQQHMNEMEKMAAQEHNEDDHQKSEDHREIAPWAKGTTLRNVERDVLIPKIMRQEAKVRCKDLVDEFSECAKGRTISLLWKCMGKNDAMKNCLAKHYQDPEFFEECKEVYLKQRDEFQEVWKETGKTKMPQKKKETYNF